MQAEYIPPVIAVLKWLAKEGIKQHILMLRPLLLTSEEIHSYLGGTFFGSRHPCLSGQAPH